MSKAIRTTENCFKVSGIMYKFYVNFGAFNPSSHPDHLHTSEQEINQFKENIKDLKI